MAQKILIKYIHCLIFNLLLFLATTLNACGWNEDEESIRVSLFRAQMSYGFAFDPFKYSFNYFNSYQPDPERYDQLKNCAEWQTKMGPQVSIKDIDLILYNTEPELFELAFTNNALSKIFSGNTFIQSLLLKENKDVLNYLTFAKEMEYFSFTNLGYGGKWESWGIPGGSTNYIKEYTSVEKLIPAIEDTFLQQRYAFLMLRYFYYVRRNEECIKMYDTYFLHSRNSVIEPWALLFKAHANDALGNHDQANYLFSKVFDRSDEKKLSAYQNFNKKQESLDRSLALAANDKERSVILTMSIANYPGPALEKIKVISELGAEEKYMAFLITREINKLEDWIFTPKLTIYNASVPRKKDKKGIWYYNDHWADYEAAKVNNYKKDIIYLRQLRTFLVSLQPGSKGEFKDLLAIAIAHLYYMDDDLVSGKKYINSIPETANVYIKNQKYVELALVELKNSNLKVNPNNTVINTSLFHLEKIAGTESAHYKSLYSLLRIMSNSYKAAGNNAVAALLYTKSDIYKSKSEILNSDLYYNYFDYYRMYSLIGYLDRIASPSDIDKVLHIIEKKNKTDLEKFLCDQPLADKHQYLDLKGTLAFRNNDLKLASEVFSQIPQTFYDTAYYYRDYLNEDPFFPKAFRFQKKRNFNYPFKKSEFINTLISLKQEAETDVQKAADNYILLGHAYFNCSYWGNSWMMLSYSNSSVDEELNDNDYLYGRQYPQRQKMQMGNYYNCTLAKQYYTKALKSATNDEQKAMASLMIHVCEYDAYLASLVGKEYDETKRYIPGISLKKFYSDYKETNVFKTFSCPLLEDFIARK